MMRGSVQSWVSGMRRVAWVALVGAGLMVLSTRWIQVNTMASVPVGIYRITPPPTPLTPGLLVTLRTPASVRLMSALHGGLVGRMALLKPVAAVAGETVCRRAGHLWIGGTDYGPVFGTAEGVTLPSAIAEGSCETVPEAHVFLASAVPKSVDSRYFGCVRTEDIRAVATPMLTWGAGG